MTDLEINRLLALAIGWMPWNGRIVFDRVEIRWYSSSAPKGYFVWRNFDYRDHSVIWPIAKRYDLFPIKRLDGTWVANRFNMPITDTPEKAVALAVIESQKK